MEDVRAVGVDQHAMLIDLVKGVATDVGALVNDQDRVASFGQFACADAAGEAGSDDEELHGISQKITSDAS